jgi:hypothetical protein
MAAIVFPTSPTTNQVYSANGTTWIWDGTTWSAFTPAPSVAWTGGTLNSGNASGSTGSATSTATTAPGIPSPYGNSGALLVSNGSQWVLGTNPPPFAAGTAVLFYQAAAPTGWTQVTSLNDYALRLVSSAGGTTGGTTAFSTVFTDQTPTIGATTLSVAQMPSHAHSIGGGGGYGLVNGGGDVLAGGDKGAAGIDANGSSSSHTHSSTAVTLSIRYANIIICTKN